MSTHRHQVRSQIQAVEHPRNVPAVYNHNTHDTAQARLGDSMDGTGCCCCSLLSTRCIQSNPARPGRRELNSSVCVLLAGKSKQNYTSTPDNPSHDQSLTLPRTECVHLGLFPVRATHMCTEVFWYVLQVHTGLGWFLYRSCFFDPVFLPVSFPASSAAAVAADPPSTTTLSVSVVASSFMLKAVRGRLL